MIKRLFDIIFSFIGILVLLPVIALVALMSSINTQSNGIFKQKRVGQYGDFFTIYKLKTVHPVTRKINSFSRLLRKSKLDELPQLFNILKGDMSFVGPRPDIEGYYDQLQGEERKILDLKPGLTSEASLKYKNEEHLLLQQDDPLKFNDEVLFPDKVKLNLEYYHNQSFFGDVKIIFKTIKTIF